MPRKFKEFVKMIVKTPYEITSKTSKKIQISLFDHEICHVTLLAILSRLQVCLTFSLETLGKCLYDKQWKSYFLLFSVRLLWKLKNLKELQKNPDFLTKFIKNYQKLNKN